MSTAAQVLSFVLALVFLASGASKFTAQGAAMAEHLGTTSISKLVGLLEIIGAAGLVLAALGAVSSSLGGAAAVCFAVLMAGAIGTHLKVGDPFVPKDGHGWAPAAVLLAVSSAAAVLILS